MINRALIRLKVLQLVYSYYQNSGKTTEVAVKELEYSQQQAHVLYKSLLSLIAEIHKLACEKAALRAQSPLGGGAGNADQRLADNLFLRQLAENKELGEFTAKQKHGWGENDKFVRNLYSDFVSSDCFRTYLDRREFGYEDDREIIRRFYKNHILHNDAIDDILEEQNLYWNDDKEIIDSFVMKTIKRFDPANGADQPLLPLYGNDEDQDFASRLFLTTIEQGETIRGYMAKSSQNWKLERMALMDVIILQIAVAEVIAFPSIPLNVTFSEYIEMAKFYSTPRSHSYVHGMLDSICKMLNEQGIINKQK